MSADDEKKSWGGLYGMVFIGLITGIVGLPRYYLKQRMRGSLMSLLFLGGLVLVVHHYISIYLGIAAQAVDALSNLGSGQANFAQVPTLTPDALKPDFVTLIGFACCALGMGWFLIDLFFLPAAFKKYNRQIEQRRARRGAQRRLVEASFDESTARHFLQQK